MNAKLFSTIATVAFAVASAAAMTSAFAVEATQFNPEAGAKARADVQAELTARNQANVLQYGEATVFVDKASNQSRTAVATTEPDASVQVVRLGEATEFIDRPGTRSRSDVRAETLASIRQSRAH